MTQSEHDSKNDVQNQNESVSGFRSIRETAEAVAVALVLVFLFKAFFIEVYCIPTGSMASTLMGRHKDVHCEACGFPFQFSASQESNDGSEAPRPRDQLPKVVGGTCPLCQFTMYVGNDNLARNVYMSYSGDRIIVNKSLFNFREPSRWHVTVFRYPAKPQVNYIKRLVGVENETVMLRNGQVFAKKEGSEHFEIQRKPLRVLLSMMRPVDDNDYVIPAIHELGWKTRWFSDDGLNGTVWHRSEDYRSFTARHEGDEPAWLQFRYITASTSDWNHLLQGTLPKGHTGTPQLITDSLDYNTHILQSPSGPRREIHDVNSMQFLRRSSDGIGLNWVGDLVLRCTLTLAKEGGAEEYGDIAFRLVKGGINFQCNLILGSMARATFSIPSVPEFEPFEVVLPTVSGRHDIIFCNMDEEMRLIINGKEVDTQGRGRYDHLALDGSPLCRDRSPTELDLTPAAIGIRRGSVHVANLKIKRNMYYISTNDHRLDNHCDLIQSPFRYDFSFNEDNVRQILSTPSFWGNFGKTRRTEFVLGQDQFLMCGDNSAQSKDSRLWMSDGIPHYVDRKHLIGEAVYVFWPHGLRIPGTRLAVIPNVSKMRWID